MAWARSGTAAVGRAFAAVPRHVFTPEVPVELAYHPEHAVVTKRGRDGVALSAVSAARIQALMLEQAGIEPGMRVLEIGSGGYNAALIAELAGEAGQVTTVDIDPDVTGRAAVPRGGYPELARMPDPDCGRLCCTCPASPPCTPSSTTVLTSTFSAAPRSLRGPRRAVEP